MSTLRRLATMTAAVAGALLATLALTTTAAHADDAIQVDLNGVGGNTNAGAFSFSRLTGTYTNESDGAITNIRAVFTIHLDGLTPDGVRIQRALGADLAKESAGDGTVRITDPLSFDMGKNNRRQTSYFMQFDASAPSGRASITLELYSGGTRLGGDSASTNVRGGGEPKRTTSTPPNTNPGIVPTFEAGPTFSLAPLPDSAELASDAGVPATLYVMGGLLVGLGGVILFLLFRRQRPAAALVEYPVARHDEPRPPSLGYPKPAGTHPTAMLPTVRNSEPTDPWRRP